MIDVLQILVLERKNSSKPNKTNNVWIGYKWYFGFLLSVVGRFYLASSLKLLLFFNQDHTQTNSNALNLSSISCFGN